MGSSRQVYITDAVNNDNYSEVVESDSIFVVNGERVDGYIPVGQADGSVEWSQNSGVKEKASHPTNYSQLFFNEDTGVIYRLL